MCHPLTPRTRTLYPFPLFIIGRRCPTVRDRIHAICQINWEPLSQLHPKNPYTNTSPTVPDLNLGPEKLKFRSHEK